MKETWLTELTTIMSRIDWSSFGAVMVGVGTLMLGIAAWRGVNRWQKEHAWKTKTAALYDLIELLTAIKKEASDIWFASSISLKTLEDIPPRYFLHNADISKLYPVTDHLIQLVEQFRDEKTKIIAKGLVSKKVKLNAGYSVIRFKVYTRSFNKLRDNAIKNFHDSDFYESSESKRRGVGNIINFTSPSLEDVAIFKEEIIPFLKSEVDAERYLDRFQRYMRQIPEEVEETLRSLNQELKI